MWYLCYFLHRHLDFRRQEVQALADTCGCGKEIEWRIPVAGNEDSPFWYINIPMESQAVSIGRRAMLVKGIYEVWGEGTTWEECAEEIKKYPEERITPYTKENTTFKVVVEGFGKSITREEQMSYIHSMTFIDFQGKVSIKNAEHTFSLIKAADPTTNNGLLGDILQERFYFGREVAVCDRSVIPKYNLSQRDFIGSTSMDPELSFMMCNMTGVEKGSLVLDPFVGTGSILVSASHKGAYVIGAPHTEPAAASHGPPQLRGRTICHLPVQRFTLPVSRVTDPS
ncbi:hypothetical protein CYMTET_30355 [Cymbomonas tetramitiformis]|uniref:Uncharacterized protein n=1 Tax=Cymbomonas tetramitiformis TaxID=36881 RepID=A0AAE0KU85_9CHLO|nr:hypothetical protein CYMTET_30355 [Cymbomonas tetramitiformis]